MTDSKKLILVVDGGPTSQTQIERCKTFKPSIAGVLDCTKKPDAALCRTIAANGTGFPAWCHTERMVCVVGLRTTQKQLDDLFQ